MSILLVLIETLWNVKKLRYHLYKDDEYCINRNIMECKEILSKCAIITTIRINRNIMECKEK